MKISKADASELARIIHRLGHHMGMLGLTGNIEGYEPEIAECLRILTRYGIPVEAEGLPLQALTNAHRKD